MVIFENNPSDYGTWSIWCHVGIHVNFTSTSLHSHTLSVPQAWCEANLDWLCLFHQWECLKCNGHGLLVSCVRWPLGVLTSDYMGNLHVSKTEEKHRTNISELCLLFFFSQAKARDLIHQQYFVFDLFVWYRNPSKQSPLESSISTILQRTVK